MTLSIKEVEHFASLARLELSETEKTRYAGQLSAILAYAARLQELDTTGIPPTSSVLPAQSALRADVPRPGLSPEELFKNAPERKGNQFRVPPVLE